eukprot:3084593-Rhodomonas_salina.1
MGNVPGTKRALMCCAGRVSDGTGVVWDCHYLRSGGWSMWRVWYGMSGTDGGACWYEHQAIFCRAHSVRATSIAIPALAW